jgi:hypothetical protein
MTYKMKFIVLFMIFLSSILNVEAYSGTEGQYVLNLVTPMEFSDTMHENDYVMGLIINSATSGYLRTEGSYKMRLNIYNNGVGGKYSEGEYGLYIVPDKTYISYTCDITANDPLCTDLQNQAPAVNAGSDRTINVGGTYSELGSFVDPDSTLWAATVDYGDGSGPQVLILNNINSFSLYHAYSYTGSYTVTVLVIDNEGNSGLDTTQISVVDSTLPPIRFINGTVKDRINKTGIGGVKVSYSTLFFTTTNASGFYSFSVTNGSYDLTATLNPTYYMNNTIPVSTFGEAVVVQDIELVKKPTGTITGNVVKYRFDTIPPIIALTSPNNIMYNITEIHLNVSANEGISIWKYSLNGANNVTFTPNTNITASQGTNNLIVYAMDLETNWNSSSVSFSVDSIAPASVDNLENVSYALDFIIWTWTNPQDTDFAKVMVYLDSVYQKDALIGNRYFMAFVSPGTHTIGTRTVDINGNINSTMVTHTATTIIP